MDKRGDYPSEWRRRREAEVFQVSAIWRPDDGPPWDVTFKIVELAGRLECVGVEVCSFVSLPSRTPGSNVDTYERYLSLPLTEGEEESPWPAPGGEPRTIGGMLGEFRGGSAPEGMGAPVPLRASMLRALPFGHLFRKAMAARSWTQEINAAMVDSCPWTPERDAAEKAFFMDEEERWKAPPSRPGRRPHYGAADLERVAACYSAAFAAGSDSPTKDVSERLGIPRSSAAKLVMKCRKQGLLAPTEQRKAGGMAPPETPQPKELT